jgi:hypothetical protein
MKKSDNFDVTKWLVENKITTQSRLNENEFISPNETLDIDEEEIKMKLLSTLSNYYKQKGLNPIESIHLDDIDKLKDNNYSAYIYSVDSSKKEKYMGIIYFNKNGNAKFIRKPNGNVVSLDDIIPPKQKTGSSKSITLTPLQKKEFLSAIRDLKRAEDLEYALGEAGNILANIITNGEAEYIEDVEDFGYDVDEVENYAQELASPRR